MPAYLATGQTECYDPRGRPIPCERSGQDAGHPKGLPWPSPRFAPRGALVGDRLTGLVWTRDANPAELPLTWQEALDSVRGWNRAGWLGHADWRLPNRRELRSLLCFQTRRPALAPGHPFVSVYPSWYWTATSLARAPMHAWYVNLDGARTFFGGKDQSFLLWPVRGQSRVLPRSGQHACYGPDGSPRPCPGTGEDGEHQAGVPWPEPRLLASPEGLEDRMTRLVWHPTREAIGGPLRWAEALAAAQALGHGWRLPNINELDSLVDCARGGPALPLGGGAGVLAPGYWSSTTSSFEPDWAWALYTEDGAIGVGEKRGAHFHLWPVRDPSAG
ncbi:MAG: DUF1566 domain-containing protein [Chromatiaceae bacterium]|jgi:hypothetical protein|nr:DUF1566 domain-containing protein [Chromatiaceae bacterium]